MSFLLFLSGHLVVEWKTKLERQKLIQTIFERSERNFMTSQSASFSPPIERCGCQQPAVEINSATLATIFKVSPPASFPPLPTFCLDIVTIIDISIYKVYNIPTNNLKLVQYKKEQALNQRLKEECCSFCTKPIQGDWGTTKIGQHSRKWELQKYTNLLKCELKNNICLLMPQVFPL